MSDTLNKKDFFCQEPHEATKKVVEIFGEDILADHRRFCAAFSDIAPKLTKENKSFFVALSENVGAMFLSFRDEVANGKMTPEDVSRRAMTIVSEYLNAEKSRMVVSGLSYALGWEPTLTQESVREAEEADEDISPEITSPTEFSGSVTENLFRRADEGDVNAQFNLAERFFFGNGVKHSYTRAVHWFRKAAIAGDCSAQKRLGDCYRSGQGLPKDYRLAVHWYGKAAEQGDFEAQQALVRCYKTGGTNLKKDLTTAQSLASRYGIKLSRENITELLKESATNGSIPSQLRLADMLFYGKGIAQDKTEAVFWYERAASQNNPEAQYSLARCYADGEGTAKSPENAFYWYEKAAENGHCDAINNLACCYYNGNGAAKIPQKAAELYHKAAEIGNAVAQYNYGECCYNGIGMIKNPGEAALWYKKSAAQGNPDAQYSLGWCHYHGEGVKQDFSAAKRLFELSAQQRNPHAQLALGYCYLNGQGTDRNYAKAAEWFNKAAARGLSEAAVMLVKCLATGGFYLPKNTEKARKTAEKYNVDYSEL